jgi:hypothetical protein
MKPPEGQIFGQNIFIGGIESSCSDLFENKIKTYF